MTGGKRKRNDNASAVDDENENPNEKLNSKVENLHKNLEKFLEKMEKSKESDAEIQQKSDERLENLEHQQKLILEELQKINKTDKQEKADEEKKPSFNSVISPGFLMKNTPSNGAPPPIGRSFVLKHVFENVSKMEEETDYESKVEDHFGVPWSMSILKKNELFDFCLRCDNLVVDKSLNIVKWEIEIKRTFKFIGVNGNVKEDIEEDVFRHCDNEDRVTAWGELKFVSFEEMKKDYLVDDKLTAEIHVEIIKMTGVYKENLRSFDESTKEVSDMVLVVGEQKFYVLKLYLAAHSPYFKALFLGQFQESTQPEIKLSGIQPEDFQNFLEVLYGDPAIDETTVEGILLVADMYDTQIVMGKCESFLLEKSEKSNRKMLQMAIRYKLDKLRAKCMSEIKTTADIKSVIPGNAEDLDHSILAMLLEKSLSFQ